MYYIMFLYVGMCRKLAIACINTFILITACNVSCIYRSRFFGNNNNMPSYAHIPSIPSIAVYWNYVYVYICTCTLYIHIYMHNANACTCHLLGMHTCTCIILCTYNIIQSFSISIFQLA